MVEKMKIRTSISILVCYILVGMYGCGSTTKRATYEVEPGMTSDEVLALLGSPSNRSFSSAYEAWQYDDVVGFGQCQYVTIWFENDVVFSMTSRRGDSVAGCGLGSRPVDWSNIPEQAQPEVSKLK